MRIIGSSSWQPLSYITFHRQAVTTFYSALFLFPYFIKAYLGSVSCYLVSQGNLLKEWSVHIFGGWLMRKRSILDLTTYLDFSLQRFLSENDAAAGCDAYRNSKKDLGYGF